MIPHEMMAPLMFAGLVIFMLIGYPVAFSLAAVGLSFGFIAIHQGLFDFSFMQALPEWVPGIPAKARTITGWPLVKKCLWGIVPSLVLIFLVLGTIFLGLATPTEGGAMGMVGAIVLAVLHRAEFSRRGKLAAKISLVAICILGVIALVASLDTRLPAALVHAAGSFLSAVRAPLFIVFYAGLVLILWEAVVIAPLRSLILQAAQSTMRITAMVIFILIGSTIFTLVFRGVDGDLWLEHMLLNLPGGKVGFLLFVNLFVFFLAFFLDFFEIAFIVIPLLAPVAAKLGIDLIWFGVLLCVNIQTSFMHPPFGFALFYLRGIAPKTVRSSQIYWGAIPWVVLQLVMVGIVIAWPGLVTAFLEKASDVDPTKIQILIPTPDYEQRERGTNAPPSEFGTPGKLQDGTEEAKDLEKQLKRPK